MASTRQKGRNKELAVKKMLEMVGYDVILTPMPTKYAKQQDFFGLWDVIAVDSQRIRFIQVKSRKIYGAELEPYQLWKNPPNSTKEIWVIEKGNKTPVITILP